MTDIQLLLIALLVLAATFPVLILLHIVLAAALRVLRHPKGPQLCSILALLLLDAILLAGCAVFLTGLPTIEAVCYALYLLLAVSALGFFYFQCINVALTSIHMQILMSVANAGSIEREALLQRYNDQGMIENRINRLVELGQVVREGDSIRLKSFLLVGLSAPIFLWRLLLGLEGEDTVLKRR